MKKVLVFLDYFYNGGIEHGIINVCNRLNNKYDFKILSFVNKSDNKKVISLLNKNRRSFMIRNIIGIKELKKYMKDNSFDIIHIHCYNAFGLVYAKILKKYCNNIIIHAHNSGVDNDPLFIKRIINKFIKVFYSKNYKLISTDEYASKFCFGIKSKIIRNGVDFDKYKYNEYQRNKYKKQFKLNNKIVIGNIGRFEKQKNHIFLIKVFNELVKLNNNYHLVLIGTGKYLKKVNKIISKLNLNNNITILSNREDIPNLINMFDIYICPSLYEGFPNTCLEAQANDKITFISDTFDKDIVISNNTHIISLNKDAKYWASIIDKTKKKDGIIKKEYTVDNFADQIQKKYEE